MIVLTIFLSLFSRSNALLRLAVSPCSKTVPMRVKSLPSLMSSTKTEFSLTVPVQVWNKTFSCQITLSVLRIFVHSVSCHFFLSKIVQLNFLCEITTFTSRFLSFDTNFFQHGLDYCFFMTLYLIFSKKLGKSWRGLNGFKFSR